MVLDELEDTKVVGVGRVYVLHHRKDRTRRSFHFCHAAFGENGCRNRLVTIRIYTIPPGGDNRAMGYEHVALRVDAVVAALRAVDEVQGLSKGAQPSTHHFDRLEPIASFFEEIAKQLRQDQLYAATKDIYRLLVALNKSKTLDVSAVERSEFARALGRYKSSAKSEAARKNGAMGGRPRKDGKIFRRARQPSTQ